VTKYRVMKTERRHGGEAPGFLIEKLEISKW